MPIEPCCTYELPEGRYIIPEQLATPTGVSAEADSETTITVTWDAVDDAEDYLVEYRVAGSDDWSTIEAVEDTEATIEDLEPATEYEIRVTARADGFADSEPSDVVTATTDEPPPDQLDTPTGVAAVADGPDAIDIEWDAVDDAETYVVEYRVAGSDAWSSSDGIEDTSTTVTDLEPDTEYELRVIAQADGFADSDPSAIVTATTEELPQLDTPTGLDTQGAGATNIDIIWSSVTDAEEYTVRWSLEGEGEWTESDPVSATEYDITGLEEETEYDIQVRASAAGFTDSEWSATYTESTAVE